jgi:hypothetical protein
MIICQEKKEVIEIGTDHHPPSSLSNSSYVVDRVNQDYDIGSLLPKEEFI